MAATTPRAPSSDDFFLPELCTGSVVLVVVLIAELTAFVLTIAKHLPGSFPGQEHEHHRCADPWPARARRAYGGGPLGPVPCQPGGLFGSHPASGRTGGDTSVRRYRSPAPG